MNLVFASGFLVPQSILGRDYFRDLPQTYPDALFTNVSVLGSIVHRAGELAAAISQKFPAGDIHIVAHSMGGLDSRYLIAKNLNNLAARIKSLSTISTPHRGSPLADLLTGQAAPGALGVLAGKVLRAINADIPALGQNAAALVDLSTSSARQFNQDNPPTPGVAYRCYAANGHGSTLLIPAQLFIRLRGTTPEERDNDGVVSLASASWPGALAEAPWATDHLGEIGYDLDVPDLKTPFDYLGAIARVVKQATT